MPPAQLLRAARAAASARIVRNAVAGMLRVPALRRRAVLGLDVSTRAVGVAVVDAGAELLHNEVVTASAEEHLFHIAAAVSERVAEMHAEYGGLARVGVEDVMKSFATGKFHTQGLFKLARLNGMIGYEAWRRTGAAVEFTMPNAIRAHFDISSADGKLLQGQLFAGTASQAPFVARKGKDEAVKLAVLGFVTQAFPDLAETWAVTRTGTLNKLNYDRADAVLVALHTCNRLWETHLLADGATFRQYFDASCSRGDSGAGSLMAAALQQQAMRIHAAALREEEARVLGSAASDLPLTGAVDASSAEVADSPDDDARGALQKEGSSTALSTSPPVEESSPAKRGRRTRKGATGLSDEVEANLTAEYGKVRAAFARDVQAAFAQHLLDREKALAVD